MRMKRIIKPYVIEKFIIAILIFTLAGASAFAQINWKGGTTVIETTYAGKQEIPNMTLNNIENTYGTEARNLYIECAKSGDYYDFRKATGWWDPVSRLDGEIEHDVQTVTNVLYYEDNAYAFLGPYATIQDYFEWCKATGCDKDSTSRYGYEIIIGKRACDLLPAEKVGCNTKCF